MIQTRIALTGILAACFGSEALAQCDDPVIIAHGDSGGVFFGRAVGGVGDINGDGYGDVIGGTLSDSTNGSGAGLARVLSGLDGSVLHTWHGGSEGDWYGISVDGAGDVNGDGVPDVVVGAQKADGNGFDSGSTYVYSGMDWSLLHEWHGPVENAWFGSVVRGAGDVDADGFDDIIVAAHYGYDSQLPGSAVVYSGDTGTVLHSWDGASGGDRLGWSIDGAGDVNGDGFDDLIVGAPLADGVGEDSGRVFVYSGETGEVLHTWHGVAANAKLGWSVGGAGDVNGDGLADLIVSSVSESFVFDGDTGAELHSWTIGVRSAGAGDADGDGFADLIVLDGNGGVEVRSGVTGGVLQTWQSGDQGDCFGCALGGAGDVTGDGLGDVVIGASGSDTNGTDSGSVFVFTLACGCPADFNGDGVVDTRDFVAYLSAWAAGDAGADTDGNGVVDTRDFIEFLGVWAAGC